MVKTELFKAIDSLIPLDEHLATFRGVRDSDRGQRVLSFGGKWRIVISRLFKQVGSCCTMSSVENLVPIPSKYEVTSDNESECDVPVNDESSPIFTTFSNLLFDCNDDFTSCDDESFSHEDVPMENFTLYSNPLFVDEEIISNKIDPHYFNVESNLIESLPNRDNLFDFSPKFDYLEEFSGELVPTSIINEERIKREYEEYISLMEKLLTINAFPRPLENFHANRIIETLPTSPIPIEDSESLSNDSPSLPENESFHFDVPSSPRPLAKPLDVGIYFEPNTGLLTAIVVDISERYVHVPNVLPTQPTLCPVIDILLPFSSENDDKVHLLSHRGFKVF
nr:hypothetical protein [Tanacetum cinerariifolium]